MNETISRGVASIRMDTSGRYCLIKFFPDQWDSEDELKKTNFFTIVGISELKAYGGVPKRCEIRPAKKIDNTELFKIELKFKPATFEGISYYGSSQGTFWSFKENSPSVDEVFSYVDQLFPSAKFEVRELLSKHFNRK